MWAGGGDWRYEGGGMSPGLDILIGEFYEIELLFDLQVGCRELRRCEICVEGAIVVM